MKPKRIVCARVAGYKMPPNTVRVSRPSRYGNPFPIERLNNVTTPEAQRKSVQLFRDWLAGKVEAADDYPFAAPTVEDIQRDLRGKNLGCYCRGEPCHGSVLLKIANAPLHSERKEEKIMADDAMTPAQLVHARKQFGFTQEEMAAELRLPIKTYQNYEQNQRPIPAHLQNTIKMMRRLKKLEDV